MSCSKKTALSIVRYTATLGPIPAFPHLQPLTFRAFDVIVQKVHVNKFWVNYIRNEARASIDVYVPYPANVSNIRTKLGFAASFIKVEKVTIKDNSFSNDEDAFTNLLMEAFTPVEEPAAPGSAESIETLSTQTTSKQVPRVDFFTNVIATETPIEVPIAARAMETIQTLSAPSTTKQPTPLVFSDVDSSEDFELKKKKRASPSKLSKTTHKKKRDVGAVISNAGQGKDFIKFNESQEKDLENLKQIEKLAKTSLGKRGSILAISDSDESD